MKSGLLIFLFESISSVKIFDHIFTLQLKSFSS